jgi:phage FluMu gp28-like protein
VKWAAYQFDYLDDDSRRRVVNKSRRVGFSEVAAFRRAARALGLRFTRRGWSEVKPANQNLGSASFDQSKALLARVMHHVDAIIKGGLVRETVEQRSTSQCTLSNGKIIKALSTNPRTARGYEGDLLLDEWASHPHQQEYWAATAPLAGRTLGNPDGYEIDAVSTPLGDADMFYSMVEGELSAGFSKHIVDIYRAIGDGFPITPEELETLKLEYDEEIFDQEFGCSFIAANTRYISREIYDAAIYYEDDPAWDPNKRSLAGVTFYGGIDVARKRDYFAFCKLKKDTDGVAWHDGTDVTRNQTWDELEAWADARARGCKQVAIDATSIGSQFSERLGNRFPGRVIPVDFTPDSKERLATGLKLGLQRKRLRMRADDTETRREVLSMRKEVTKHNNIRYDIPHDSKTRSHGDRAWAAALAFDATGTATRTTRKAVAKSAAVEAPPRPERSVRVQRGAWR